MQTIEITSWSEYKELAETKKLLLQYEESDEWYRIYAQESSAFLWKVSIPKGSDDAADFEDHFKSSANKPLEYRSVDGLLKVASAKFADAKNLWLDGSSACVSLSANSTGYMKKHFDFEFTMSGVDCRWYESNWGDYIDFEVGFYTDTDDENTFVSISQFSNKYMIYQDGSRLFDVPTVKVIPIKIPGTNYDIYIRAKCVNVGDQPSKVILNLVGWK